MSTGGNNGSRVSRDVVVQNKLGLHARPASMFVKLATRFECEINVEKEGEEVNGKSIMGLMMLLMVVEILVILVAIVIFVRFMILVCIGT